MIMGGMLRAGHCGTTAAAATSAAQADGVERGAESETRTRDLSFTKALLYQLSYLGMHRARSPVNQEAV